ncbi:MAG: membrane protein insertase YidC [bacterium]
MDKNTITAVLLMVVVIVFFNSSLWQKFEEKIGWRKKTENDSLYTEKYGYKDQEYAQEKKETDIPVQTMENNSITREPAEVKPDDSSACMERTILIKNSRYTGKISNMGAKIVSWKLHGWERDSSDLEVLPQKTEGALSITFKGEYTGGRPWKCSIKNDTAVELGSRDTFVVQYKYESIKGWEIAKLYKFYGEKYDFDLAVKQTRGSRDIYTLHWNAGIRESEIEKMRYEQNPKIIFGMQDGISKEYNIKQGKTKAKKGYADFVALKSKYFFSAVIFEYSDKPQNVSISAEYADTLHSNSSNNIRYDIETEFEEDVSKYKVILAPADNDIIELYGKNLSHVIFSGWRWFLRGDIWFPALCRLVLYLLKAFYNLIPNYGIAILLLTILFRLVTFPLTLKSSKSMARMKDLQPKMTEIREKYKTEPMKQQQLIMRLYKEEGVNPFGAGCLPQFLQMPIFFSLYIALRRAIELRGAGFALWINDLSGPEYIPFLTLPMNIPFYGNRVSSLAVFMAVTMFFSSKQTITDPKQKTMIYMMPVLMLVMMNQMPAGLLLYWAVSNLLGIFQNRIIMKSKKDQPPPEGGRPVIAGRKKPKRKPLFSLPKMPKKGGLYGRR